MQDKMLAGPPQWEDVGMWLQTMMLLPRQGGGAREYVSLHAPIEEYIDVSDETHILFCGLAIGHRNPEAAVNTFQRPRIPVDPQVTFLGF